VPSPCVPTSAPPNCGGWRGGATREAVRKSLLAKGLIEAVEPDATDEAATWITDAGPASYRAIDAALAVHGAQAQEPTEGPYGGRRGR
jgi:hypothetical protein